MKINPNITHATKTLIAEQAVDLKPPVKLLDSRLNKFYVVYVNIGIPARPRLLRRAWKRATEATTYARGVLARYRSLLAAEKTL